MSSNGDRPNVLLLINDHQAYYRHGWDMGPQVMRPNFDRLASAGAQFERTYCASPLCSPARRSILTGVYPHRHGEIKNDTDHPWDIDPYLADLKRSGYQSFYYGKWHAGPGTAVDLGSEGFSYPSYNNPYTKEEYKDYLDRKGLERPKILIERSFEKDGDLVPGQLYQQERPWCNEHASGILQSPAETHDAFFVANLARDQLRELANQDGDQPFSMVVSFWGPHPPYFPSADFAALYDPEDIPKYGNFRDDLTGKPGVYHSEGNAGIGKDGKLLIPSTLPWSEWQKVIARCYAQITLVDAAGGLVLDALDQLGLADNTIVVWTTDHGDAIACHGGHFDKRSYMPEETIRVPLAIRWPGHVPAGQCRRELLSQVDIAPTLRQATGVESDSESDGSSLLPMLNGEQWESSFAVSETHGHMERVYGRAVVCDRYKYVWYDEVGEEMYDLLTDPYELANLSQEPQHMERLHKMRALLGAWQDKANDTRRIAHD